MSPKPHFSANLPIFRLFFPILRGGPREAETYSVAGQRDCKPCMSGLGFQNESSVAVLSRKATTNGRTDCRVPVLTMCFEVRYIQKKWMEHGGRAMTVIRLFKETPEKLFVSRHSQRGHGCRFSL